MNPIMQRFTAYYERAIQTTDPAALTAIKREAQDYLSDALHIDRTTLIRIYAMEHHADKALIAAKTLATLYATTRFEPCATLAHAIVRDLGEAAQLARTADLQLDSVLDNGKGMFLRNPGLLDADVLDELHRAIATPRKNLADAVSAAICALDALQTSLDTLGSNTQGLTYTPYTLATLLALTHPINRALNAAVLFASVGNHATARAILVFQAGMRAAFADGDLLEASCGVPLFPTSNPTREIAMRVLDETVHYVLAHGTREGFDCVGAAARMRDEMLSVGDHRAADSVQQLLATVQGDSA